MNLVIRSIILYIFLLVIFRLMGKRTLNEATTFDLVLLLIISEVTQQGLVGEDFSITAAIVLICTLMGIDILFTLVKKRYIYFREIVEGVPLIVVDKGKPLKNRMYKADVDEEDILAAARASQGLERMDEIKYAVLENDGSITIIPFNK